jgi:DNA polymerase
MTMHPADLPAGTQLPAGLGVATVLPDIDFETYSEAGQWFDFAAEKWKAPEGAPKGKKGLFVVGAALYALHPTTEVLSLAYNLKNGSGPRRWRPGAHGLPFDLIAHVMRGGIVEAWNSAFEWWIWNYVCVPKYGFPPLPVEQTRCAMGKARASSYPGALEMAGRVMRLTTPKDEDGKRLLDKFSVPRNPTKKDKRLRNLPEDSPEDAEKLYQYNDRDIVAEAEASSRCPDLTGEELEFWLADQRINRRGVAVDADSLHACAALVEKCLVRYDSELFQLTGGQVERASQLERLKGWLAGQGVVVGSGPGSMDEDAIDALIAGLQPHQALAKRALEIRQAVGSASVKKVFAMRNQLSPWGRLHDLFNYHGARTGRPTGEGPQPTNLPKAGPEVVKCACGRHSGAHLPACAWCGLPFPPGKKKCEWGPEAMEDVLHVIKTGDLSLVERVYKDAMLCVSGCLRGLFVAADGCDLIASDFSSIEGVVTACLAGEDWRVEMFATHGKAYELSVSKITGIPFAEIMAHAGYESVERPEWWKHRADKTKPHHPMRQTLGKVAELASGFGGWIGAWKNFGADKFMNDDEIKKAILAWREASPAIVEFWGGQERREGWERRPELFGLEGMAVSALLYPGQWFHVMRKDGTHTGVSYYYHSGEDALYCWLPSGRALTYRFPRLTANTRAFGGQYALSYEGYNTNPKSGPVGWIRMDTYSGKLCENVVQAVARDIQRYAIINLERAGYPVVLHVYDEDVVEVPQGFGSIEEVERIMGTMPAWATYKGKPWPIKAAGGWRGRRYRKE